MQYQNLDLDATCPVCSATAGSQLWDVDVDEATRHFVSPNEDNERFTLLRDHITQLWNGRVCKVVKCKNCDFVYSFPYVAGDKRFYDLAYQRSGYPKWKWEFGYALREIEELGLERPTVLEVGAGEGAFTRVISGKITTPDKITVTEYSEYGRGEIAKLGVNCAQGDVRDLSREKYAEFFDVICMFQVLEHIDDLKNLMLQYKCILKKGGRIIFAVPGEKNIEFNEINGALLDMPPNHIGRWSLKSFEKLAELYGFEINDHRYAPFEILPSILKFAQYKFLRRAQIDTSIENYIRYKSPNGYVRGALLRAGAAFHLLASVTQVFAMLRNRKDLGGSQVILLTNR